MTYPSYRPDIDGLRALSIICVMLFHADIELFSGGFVGVDVFFVISGYLITQLIYKEIQTTGTFSFTNFYIRRSRRLLPALLFTLTVCFILATLMFSPIHLQNFTNSLLYSLAFISNYFFLGESGYFHTSSFFKPLIHTWSLSVEEQFYLVWPIFIYLILSRPTKNFALLLVLLIGSISFVLNIINSEGKYQLYEIFYLTHFRIFEFAIGASMVWIHKYKTNYIIAEFLFILGVTLIVFAVFTYTNNTIFPSYNALIPCIGSALVIHSANAKYAIKLLSNPLAVGLGLISYSLYLIHWPIFVFYKYFSGENFKLIEVFLLITTSIAFAIFMYKFIEKPFRYRTYVKEKYSNSKFILGCIFVMIVIFIPSLHAYSNYGWTARIKNYVEFTDTKYPAHHLPWKNTNHVSGDIIVVYGDSHAKQYLPSITEYYKPLNTSVEYILHPACISLPNLTNIYKGSTHKKCMNLLEELKNKLNGNNYPVIVAYGWLKTLANHNGNYLGENNHSSEIEQKNYFSLFISGLNNLINEVGRNRKFIIVGDVPGTNLKSGYLACAYRLYSKILCPAFFNKEKGNGYKFNKELQLFAEKNDNVEFINPYHNLCDDEFCYVVRDRKLLYSDHGHLTKIGADEVIKTNSNILSKLIL